MSQEGSASLDRARSILQTWLRSQQRSLRSFASAAGVQPSVVSRFLNGGGLKEDSALRLYLVINQDIGPPERQAFLEVTGLSALAPLFSSTIPTGGEAGVVTTEAASTENWDLLRQVIRTWLTRTGRSPRSLGQEAQLQPSILSRFLNGETTLDISSSMRLYNRLHHRLSEEERRVFLKMMGLLPLISEFSSSSLFWPDQEHAPYRLALDLQLRADDLATDYYYEEAAQTYRQAEQLLQIDHPQAAKAAIRVALMYTELGYYDMAATEMQRIETVYSDDVGFETVAEIHKITGWVSLYRGNLSRAETAFQACLATARETGYDALGEAALHFLGRVYFERARQELKQSVRGEYTRLAGNYFDQAYAFHQGWSGDYCAYDLFRKAQMLHYLGEWREAKRMRGKARRLFGADLSYLVVDLEEAYIDLENGSVEEPRFLAESVLDPWYEVGNYKHLSNALRAIAISEQLRGRWEEAIRTHVVALCAYPFENSQHGELLDHEVAELCMHYVHDQGKVKYRMLLHSIEEELSNRSNLFAYLGRISQPHQKAIERVIRKLHSYAK